MWTTSLRNTDPTRVEVHSHMCAINVEEKGRRVLACELHEGMLKHHKF